MRIAVFDNQQTGGGRRAAQELMKQLRRRGHRLHLYNYPTAAERFLPLEPLADGTTTIDFAEPLLRLPRGLPYAPLLLALRLERRLDGAGRAAARAIDQGGHDVAFVQECRYAAAPHPLRYLATPSAFYCAEPKRGLYERVPSNQRPLKGGSEAGARSPRALYHGSLKLLLVSFWRGVDRTSGGRAGAILTCSHYSRELIWRAYGVFAWTSHLGVDLNRFRPGEGEREHAVASIGELVPRKAHDFVIEAVGAIPRQRRPKVYLAANAAWPEERRYVERLAERLEVHLEIALDPGDEALARLYGRVGVLAYPPIMEPFGLVALEAMASGTPVVGVAEAGLRESILPDVTGLLTGRDVPQFSEALDRVLSDRALALRLGAAGREVASCYWSWDRACDRLEAHLARLLGVAP